MKRLLLALPAALLALAFVSPPAHAVDESPGINDTATLLSGKVTHNGDVKVKLRLTCPKKDRFSASMSMLTVSTTAPDDIFSRTLSPLTGRCKGKAQTITLHLVTAPIGGTLYPAPRNCSPEYGVNISGTGWEIAFDRGGADGGPDGPGPQLCLT